MTEHEPIPLAEPVSIPLASLAPAPPPTISGVQAILDGDYSKLNQRYQESHEKYFRDGIMTPFCPAWFMAEFRAGNEDAVVAMVTRHPKILCQIGYASMSCGGGYGMEVYKHVANIEPFATDKMRAMTYAMTKAYQGEGATKESRGCLFALYGMRGKWKEHIQAAREDGVEPTEIEKDVDTYL